MSLGLEKRRLVTKLYDDDETHSKTLRPQDLKSTASIDLHDVSLKNTQSNASVKDEEEAGVYSSCFHLRFSQINKQLIN